MKSVQSSLKCHLWAVPAEIGLDTCPATFASSRRFHRSGYYASRCGLTACAGESGSRGQQLPVVPAGLVCVSFCNISSFISSGPWINDSITSMNPSHHHHRPRASLQASQPTHGPPLPLFSWEFILKPCQATPRNYTFIIIPIAACHLISPHFMFLINASIPA